VSGLVTLAVAMLAAMFLVTDYLLEDRVAALLTGVLAVGHRRAVVGRADRARTVDQGLTFQPKPVTG